MVSVGKREKVEDTEYGYKGIAAIINQWNATDLSSLVAIWEQYYGVKISY